MIGVIPQESVSWRYTCSVSTQAMMGVSGRYLHSRRAVSPLLLTVMMAFALISMAVVQAAWATAPATLSCPSIVRIFRRLS